MMDKHASHATSIVKTALNQLTTVFLAHQTNTLLMVNANNHAHTLLLMENVVIIVHQNII